MAFRRIVADFETRSPVDIKKCGAYKYAQHPDTDVTMLAVLDVDNPSDVRMWIGPNFRHLYKSEISDAELDELVFHADTFVAHNVPFERAIWHYVMVRRYGFTPLAIDKTLDTAVMCSMVGLPRTLEKASAFLNPAGAEKDMEGAKIMKRFIAPKLPVAAKRKKLCPDNPDSIKEGYSKAMDVLSLGGIPDYEYHRFLDWHEDESDFARMVEYCRRDVLAEYNIFRTLPAIHPSEKAMWVLDQEINDRGVCIDIESAKGITKTVSRYSEDLMKEVYELTGGKVTSMKAPAQIKEWLLTEGIEVDSIAKASVEYLLTLDLKPVVRRVLEIRETLGKSSVAKYNAMFACASEEDNRVRGIHAFYGAGTGRWAGRLLQTQNLPRPSGKDNLVDPHSGDEDVDEQTISLAACGDPSLPLIWYKDINVLAADCIRGMLVAPKGRDFICSDFSSVEAKALAHLANEEAELAAYRSGKDIYKVNAALIYSIPYEQVDGGGKGPQRQVGKTASLACLAEDTRVLTLRGVVPITEVTQKDFVWDGVDWVPTEGCIYRGIKEVINFEGVRATPDHLWLMEDGTWQRTDGLKRISEKSTEILRLWGTTVTNSSLGKDEYLQNVYCAETSGASELTILKQEAQLNAGNVVTRCNPLHREFTSIWKNRIAREIYIDCGTPLHGVKEKTTLFGIGTGVAESKFAMNGKTIPTHFLSMQRLWTDGIKKGYISIESTITGITNPEIYDSCHRKRITGTESAILRCVMVGNIYASQSLEKDMPMESNAGEKSLSSLKKGYPHETLSRFLRGESVKKGVAEQCKVYDLLNCGPRNRFAIITEEGVRIVHNCGYSGGYSALCRFGFDKMPLLEADAYQAIAVMEETMREDNITSFTRMINPMSTDYEKTVISAYENPATKEMAESFIKEVRGTWIVKQWRKNHPKTTQLWNDMKMGSIQAVQYKNATVSVCDGVEFYFKDRFLTMRLPSGRRLFYLDPRIEEVPTSWGSTQRVVTSMSVNSVTKQLERRQLNVSILVENLVQAFCRDLLKESMLRLDAHGYDIVAHIHDEILSEVDEGFGSVEEYEALMSQVPEWAKGMPLQAAGGYRSKRYRK